MKNKLLLSLAVIVIASNSFAQNVNVTLRAQLTYPGQTCANICGYVDSLGNEYALVGASVGLSIVDVTNPSAPVQVYQHTGPTGPNSFWQEIKVRGKYAYVTTEAGGGLQIFNLSSLPNVAGITTHSYTGDGAIAGTLGNIHALHIDGHYVYLYGSSLFNGGAIAADITDPYNPVYAGNYSVGVGNARYVHDGYVRNDTLYAGHIYQGYFSVVDFTNKAAPVEITNQITPNNFTHNTWLSTNSKVLFTTDETPNSFLTSYDISNLGSIAEMDRIQSNPGSNSAVHNTHIINVGGNDYAVTSWYHDGFTITDVGRPQNMVQVGNYDTYAGTGAGFDGDWGVYPYLPSGTIVVSNIGEGLFVFTPNYVRACYLEGTVTDSVTGIPINTASAQILTAVPADYTDVAGLYKTGIPSPGGTYSVTYSKPGYFPKTITGIVLAGGVVTVQNVQLAKKPLFAFTGQVVESGTGTPIPNADVRMFNSGITLTATTNTGGTFSFPQVYTDAYDFIVGKWGYVTDCAQSMIVTSAAASVTLHMNKGYYDDFTFNNNWTIQTTASTGAWTRGVPLGTHNGTIAANAGTDDSTDCTNIAYITGNTGTTASDDDVDGGATILTSPVFDLSGVNIPVINYTRWFYTGGGSGTLNDSLSIYLTNGTTTVMIDNEPPTATTLSQWIPKTLNISTFITPTATMKLIVRTADNNPGHIVEAGFDKFFISDAATGITSHEKESNDVFTVYPNPFGNEITLSYSFAAPMHTAAKAVLYDITGRVIESYTLSNAQGKLNLHPAVQAGVYFISISTKNGTAKPVKIIKY